MVRSVRAAKWDRRDEPRLVPGRCRATACGYWPILATPISFGRRRRTPTPAKSICGTRSPGRRATSRRMPSPTESKRRARSTTASTGTRQSRLPTTAKRSSAATFCSKARTAARRGASSVRISPVTIGANRGPRAVRFRTINRVPNSTDTILYVATTKLDPALIWVTTDDGLVQITRNAGGPAKVSWENVSPPLSLVPPWGRITGIDPGRFAAGTAFIAVERHLDGDERPYVLATDDYGKTWRSIAGDLPHDQYVRTVRQDPRASQRALCRDESRRLGHVQRRIALAVSPVEYAGDGGLRSRDRSRRERSWSPAPTGAACGYSTTSRRSSSGIRRNSASVTLFAPRDALRMWNWPPVNTFTDPVLPYNDYIGDGGDGGAIVTYFLPRAAKTASLTVLDSAGRPIRHLKAGDVGKDAGMNRASWDLTEDGPVQWNGTYKQNRGPDEGAEVVPGRYTVQLTVDGVAKSQPLTVKPDPRDPAVAACVARYDALAALYGELSTIDTMLNANRRIARNGLAATGTTPPRSAPKPHVRSPQHRRPYRPGAAARRPARSHFADREFVCAADGGRSGAGRPIQGSAGSRRIRLPGCVVAQVRDER